MTVARFPVTGTLDGAGARSRGTVTIDRETNLFSVRPLRRKKTWPGPAITAKIQSAAPGSPSSAARPSATLCTSIPMLVIGYPWACRT